MHPINLDHYILQLYVNDSFDLNLLANESFINQLNGQQYPRGIVEQLEAVGNLTRIQIYDTTNNLILSSEYAVE